MTHQELHNTFNATDLQEYCKENGLLATGKKVLVIKRILKFLQTGEKELPKNSGRGKRAQPEPVTEDESNKEDVQANSESTSMETDKESSKDNTDSQNVTNGKKETEKTENGD